MHIYRSDGKEEKKKKKEEEKKEKKEEQQIKLVCNLTKELTSTKLAADVFGAPSQQNGCKKVG